MTEADSTAVRWKGSRRTPSRKGTSCATVGERSVRKKSNICARCRWWPKRCRDASPTRNRSNTTACAGTMRANRRSNCSAKPGLDPSLIGYKRIERCFARWRKIACRMGTDRLVSVDGNGGVVPSASADAAPSAESAEVARSAVSQPVQPNAKRRKRKAMRRCPRRATQPRSRFCREVTCATCSSPSRCAASTSWNARWRRCGRNCIANNRKNRKKCEQSASSAKRRMSRTAGVASG